ncbi:MAG: hypothetical protein IH991_15050 [Planctomycetes bacterium]|nr:hypothetical protein [Planctomycetota bacterium]
MRTLICFVGMMFICSLAQAREPDLASRDVMPVGSGDFEFVSAVAIGKIS